MGRNDDELEVFHDIWRLSSRMPDAGDTMRQSTGASDVVDTGSGIRGLPGLMVAAIANTLVGDEAFVSSRLITARSLARPEKMTCIERMLFSCDLFPQ